MNKTAQKYVRLIPAIYFMLLGIVSIAMESAYNGFSPGWFCMYAVLLLPILLPVRFLWTTFGALMILVSGAAFLNGVLWFVQYLNGAYFKYPFDTFVIGFPFILGTLFCAAWMFYLGLTWENHRVPLTSK